MSWSFRKDCVGFARSIWDSGEVNKTGVMKLKNDEDSLEYLLCILIGYFVSTVSSDIDEWLTWGKI